MRTIEDIDPITKTVIETMRALWPDLGGTVTEVREAREIVASIPSIGEPQAVAKVDNRTFDFGTERSIGMRLYWPIGNDRARDRLGDRDEPLPATVFFHGGGWVLGGLDTHDHLAREMANSAGTVVFSVDYRLAPESPFPAAVIDAVDATRFVVDHASELGIDQSRVAVAGDSAGGNLAAVVAQVLRDDRDHQLVFQLLICPVTDCDLTRGSYEGRDELWFLTPAHMRWYWDHYVPDAKQRSDPRCSPLRADELCGLAPAYVATAQHDPLRDEGEAYAELLKVAGTPVEYRCFDALAHGFSNVAEFDPVAKEANSVIFGALKDAFSRPAR